MRVSVATRGSALARWQADHVGALLTAAHPSLMVEVVVVETAGDRAIDVPIWEIGGQGVFVKEVQAAVLDGRADLAVHSAKDLPAAATPGLALACIPRRGDPRDALVGSSLDGLASGATVATGSVRRRAQLANLRPDLTFAGLRGTIDTRLAKAPAYAAIVVAAAALQRLGRDVSAEVLGAERMLPQVGQGALAVECRDDDEATAALLASVEHAASRRAVDAERAYLGTLGSGCELPVAAHATVGPGGEIELDGMIATLDGRVLLRHRATGDDPGALGRSVADHLLHHAGGAALLAEQGLLRP